MMARDVPAFPFTTLRSNSFCWWHDMTVRIITSFSPEGYEQYGRRFLNRFEAFFDPTIRLTVYAEAGIPLSAVPRGAEIYQMLDGSQPWLEEFLARHQDNPAARGRAPRPGWKLKDISKGYCYRFDAVKFCRKVFALDHAAQRAQPGETMVWLDADTYAFREIAPEFFKCLLGDADVAYLGREPAHSECGFLAFRMPRAARLIRRWCEFYRDDLFWEEREYHDSYLFDRARGALPQIKARNVAEPGAGGHVWFKSPLGSVMDHAKGDRKLAGFSSEMLQRG